VTDYTVKLPRILRRAMARTVRSFGVRCHVRRPRDLQNQPDNSTAIVWEKVSAIPEPVRVILGALDEQARQRLFGERIEASMIGTTELRHGITEKDILRPTSGAFLNRYFKVTATRPIDEATLVDLYLVEVDAEPDYGF
jgi:hypothetical protein